MYERLPDKTMWPSAEMIRNHMGSDIYSLLLKFEENLWNNYQLIKEMKFPLGNHYGWGYKYSHQKSHLNDTFFESGAFTVMPQLGDKCVSEVEQNLPVLLPSMATLWDNRYPCGRRGGWIHYRVFDENELNDVFSLVMIQKKPAVTA